MTTILDTLNNARETTITDHYNAAFAELKAKVTAEPLRTNFVIYSGCPSKDVATEVARRLSVGDIDAKLSPSRWFGSRLYLEVKVSLPETLRSQVEIKLENAKSEQLPRKKEEVVVTAVDTITQ